MKMRVAITTALASTADDIRFDKCIRRYLLPQCFRPVRQGLCVETIPYNLLREKHSRQSRTHGQQGQTNGQQGAKATAVGTAGTFILRT